MSAKVRKQLRAVNGTAGWLCSVLLALGPQGGEMLLLAAGISKVECINQAFSDTLV